MERQPTTTSLGGEKKPTERNNREQVHGGAAATGPTWDTTPIQLKRAAESPMSASPAGVLGLQRTLGNRATSRLLKNARERSSAEVVQAKAGSAGTPAARSCVNQTGLPDPIKAGLEDLSGYSLDDVKVHYNSDAPARIQAKAFTKGTDIHVAPGEEQHVAHEGWHVVQQKQGRVKPTLQLKGESLNDDSALEREADEMGARAMSFAGVSARPLEQGRVSGGVIQGKVNTSSLRAFIEEQTALQTEKKAVRDEHKSAEEKAQADNNPLLQDANQSNQPHSQANEIIEDEQDDESSSALHLSNEVIPSDDKQYTTVGFEHEFGEMRSGPLRGVTHLELAESEDGMPYTGIPFILETDAQNAIELVSPPFLIETLPDSPIPDADDVHAVDSLFKTTLVNYVQNAGTLGGLLGQFRVNAGIMFNVPNTLQIGRKNMTQNTSPDIYNNKMGLLGSDTTSISALEALQIQVGTTTKGLNFGEDYHVSTHVNFAADAETYDDLQEQYKDSGDVHRAAFAAVESQLRELLFDSAFGGDVESVQGDMDAVRSLVNAAESQMVPLLEVLFEAVNGAALNGGPMWTWDRDKWTRRFASSVESSLNEVKSGFEKISEMLGKTHITPFIRDEALEKLTRTIERSVKQFREVKDKAYDANEKDPSYLFPKALMQQLWGAQITSQKAVAAVQGMPFPSQGKEGLRVFLNSLARQLSGQIAVDAIKAVKRAQEKRYGSSLKMNRIGPSLMPSQMMSSRVKDVKEVWIKDTIMNIGLGILEPEDWKVVQRVMKDEAVKTAVNSMELSALETKEKNEAGDEVVTRHELSTRSFRAGVLGALNQIHTYIEDEGLAENASDPKKFIGPEQQPDFMSHDPKWIGARQDTYIVSKRVQMPEMWGSKRLHVVEVRNDAVDRLRKLKAYRQKHAKMEKHGHKQGPVDELEIAARRRDLAPRQGKLRPILEDEMQQDEPLDLLTTIIEEEEEESLDAWNGAMQSDL
ncbi:MAG: DUF4157 domain-containing protein [Polyangiaceae bacterium]|nr:DUF4157 domain-containing protein [Polyangiaceae bacterium]